MVGTRQRFTFAVCADCGVQSPPVFIDDEDAFRRMGWQYSRRKFYSISLCPQCLKKDEVETTDEE